MGLFRKKESSEYTASGAGDVIYLLLADGFEEIEALTPLDMLRRAGLNVKTVAIHREKTVRGAHGIEVIADLSTEDAEDIPSLLILPGGMPGAKNLDGSAFVDALICKTATVGGRLAAICAAPFILGKRGYLNGKRAVCYPGFEKDLTGAVVTDSGVETDGNVTTAAGMGVALAFAKELVRLMKDEKTAEQLMESIQAYRN